MSHRRDTLIALAGVLMEFDEPGPQSVEQVGKLLTERLTAKGVGSVDLEVTNALAMPLSELLDAFTVGDLIAAGIGLVASANRRDRDQGDASPNA